MKQESETLILPENCPPKDYVIIGFTKDDIIKICACATVGVIFALSIYGRNGNSIAAVAVFFASVIIGVNLFRRDKCTENLIDKIKVIKAYRAGKKSYIYQYMDMWSMENGEKK